MMLSWRLVVSVLVPASCFLEVPQKVDADLPSKFKLVRHATHPTLGRRTRANCCASWVWKGTDSAALRQCF